VRGGGLDGWKGGEGMRGMKDTSLGWSSTRLEGCWVPHIRIYISMAFILVLLFSCVATCLVRESSCGVAARSFVLWSVWTQTLAKTGVI
jgi:hypothetical protein